MAELLQEGGVSEGAANRLRFCTSRRAAPAEIVQNLNTSLGPAPDAARSI